MSKIKVGFALCGSFCTIADSINEMKKLADKEYEIFPICSEIMSNTDTRFGKAEDIKNEIVKITGKEIISTIKDAEPIGPKKLFDILIVCPCTGNTLAKLSNGITDSSVTMAVKAHLRNMRPVVLAIATNDALGASAKNIGALLNYRDIYFVPFAQDDPVNKEKSLIADFSLLEDTVKAALTGKQIRPVIK